jgi:hypothetical protein
MSEPNLNAVDHVGKEPPITYQTTSIPPGDRPRHFLHYTELPPGNSEGVLAEEWDCYRAEVGRLLAEGREGQHVLIKGREILGFWDTHEEALEEGYRRFLLTNTPFMVHQVRTWEPLLRPPFWCR